MLFRQDILEKCMNSYFKGTVNFIRKLSADVAISQVQNRQVPHEWETFMVKNSDFVR